MPSVINSDDGNVSGAAGLKFTSGDDGVLKLQNNGVDAITISQAGQATFANPISQPGGTMFRNKIINGNFDIWQRGTSQTASGYGSADRWHCEHSGSTRTASQQSFTLGQTDVPGNPTYFIRNAVTSVAGSGNYCVMYQKIEGVATFSGQTATVSFWAKADSPKSISIEFEQSFGSGGSPSSVVNTIGSQQVSLTTSWAKYTISVSIPSVAGKTLGTDRNNALLLIFWFDAGSNFNARSASLGQQSGTFDIAQIQLEEGAAATPFEQRPVGMELTLCERYYQRICNWTGIVDSTTGIGANVGFRVRMRAAPTVTKIANSTLSYRAPSSDRSSTTWTLTAAGPTDTAVWFQIGNLSSLTAGQASHNRLLNSNDIAQADAEL